MGPFFLRQSAMQLTGAVLAAVLVLGGAIGASAAMGGGGFVEDVLSTLHIVDRTPGEAEEGIGNAPEAAAPGREHASENAFQGSGNADDGIDNAPATADPGREHASENAFRGSGNADDGIDNAPAAADSGREHANENAFEGSGNAGDGADNAPDAADPSRHPDQPDVPELPAAREPPVTPMPPTSLEPSWFRYTDPFEGPHTDEVSPPHSPLDKALTEPVLFRVRVVLQVQFDRIGRSDSWEV